MQVSGQIGECDTDGLCYVGDDFDSVADEIHRQMDRSFASNSSAPCPLQAVWGCVPGRASTDVIEGDVARCSPRIFGQCTGVHRRIFPPPALANVQGDNAVDLDQFTDMRSLIAFAKTGERCGLRAHHKHPLESHQRAAPLCRDPC